MITPPPTPGVDALRLKTDMVPVGPMITKTPTPGVGVFVREL